MSKVKTHKTIDNVAVEKVESICGFEVYKQVAADDMSYLFFTKDDQVKFIMEIGVSSYCDVASVDSVCFKVDRDG